MAEQDFRTRYGDWALILGASEGLGRAIAHEAAARGFNVALVARRLGPLKIAAEAIAARFGVETKAIALDLAQTDAAERIDEAMGTDAVSFMVYNAAAEPHGRFLDLDLAEHEANVAVNVLTPTRLVHHFGRQMRARGKGGIVLCSSLAGVQGIYSYVSYGAAKAYEMILGEGLWDELRDDGVDACTLMIGSTYTPNFQAGQREKGTIFAETRTPPNLPEGVKAPQLPEDAAAHLFAQLEGDWEPLIYADVQDAQRAAATRDMPRSEMIRRIGLAMRSGFRMED
jgi:short-subunit dehydrogenase